MKCRYCRIGRYQASVGPYLENLDNQIMLIPDAPVQVCDICGHMQYEDKFLGELQFFMEQLSYSSTGDATPQWSVLPKTNPRLTTSRRKSR